ncbi:DUF4142 domain-containing protein [soil metagenome]
MNQRLLATAAIAAAFLFSASARAQAPSDPQIVGIVVAANQIDIDAGKLAISRAHSPEVKKFAREMVNDHSSHQKGVFALGAKLHVTPAESPTATSLKQGAADNLAHLKTLSGAAFDKTYIDHEVAYHQAVIDAVNSTLIPNAQNGELKSALEAAAPVFQGHLQHAQHIQSGLG